MANIKHFKKRLQKLIDQNPHCYWCGCKVVKSNKCNKDNQATIDHLYSKFNPMRYVYQRFGKCSTVLACNKCNKKRSHDECLQENENMKFRAIINTYFKINPTILLN